MISLKIYVSTSLMEPSIARKRSFPNKSQYPLLRCFFLTSKEHSYIVYTGLPTKDVTSETTVENFYLVNILHSRFPKTVFFLFQFKELNFYSKLCNPYIFATWWCKPLIIQT